MSGSAATGDRGVQKLIPDVQIIMDVLFFM
jgi:hypothetical protein